MKEINIRYTIRFVPVIVVWTMLYCSCKVTTAYHQPIGIVSDKLYRSISSTDTTNIAVFPWNELFRDTLLQKLIEEGINNNTDLTIARARIKSAAASFKQSKLFFLPALNAGTSATFQSVSPSQFGFPETYQLNLTASWLADIWGQLRSNKRAALAALLQSDAYKRAVLTQLIADIAINYYSLLALDAELNITQTTLALRKEEIETMKVLKESDVVTGAAVVQSAANSYSVEITIPDLKQDIRETENAISILLGRAPDSIFRTKLSDQYFSPQLKTGIPALLLANRPDVQEAEFRFRNAFELTNVARTYFYPSLNITASTGFSNINAGKLFNPSSFFSNITGSLLQPIFNQGLNRQQLIIAEARSEEYLAAFKQTILNAGNEVSNALYSYQTAVEKETLRLQEITYLEKAVDYTKELLKYSSKANYTDVLTSEQSLLAAQLGGINDKLQQLTAVISLYKSLGGGWR